MQNVTNLGVDRLGTGTSLTIAESSFVEGADGQGGLFLHSDASCTEGGAHCRQEWRVEMTAAQCTLHAIFNAFFKVCYAALQRR